MNKEFFYCIWVGRKPIGELKLDSFKILNGEAKLSDESIEKLLEEIKIVLKEL